MREFGVIIDLDGTLIHKGKATLGAKEFIDSLKRNDIPFRIITNSVGRTQSELSDKASMVGIDIDECLIFNPITALDKYLVDNEIDSFLFVGPSKIESNLSVESRVEDELIEEPGMVVNSLVELLDDLDEEEPRFWKASALTNS